MDPVSSTTLYFGTHRLYKTVNEGASWTPISFDLTRVSGFITTIAVAKSDPGTIYVGASDGMVNVTRDGGLNFIPSTSGLPNKWVTHIAVDPTDADTVYVPNVAVNRTRDGGKTWVVLRGSPGGDDYHQTWINPADPNTMIVASDQGAVITRNARTNDPREVTWTSSRQKMLARAGPTSALDWLTLRPMLSLLFRGRE